MKVYFKFSIPVTLAADVSSTSNKIVTKPFLALVINKLNLITN